jgi:redox-sensing transcriptional repressor
MSFGDVATRSGGRKATAAGGPLADRLSLGVAAASRATSRCSRRRARWARRRSPRRSSRVHARQLDADPPRPLGFGKFGKRGVGYNVDSLVSQIRKILRTSGQHNIALFGAGHLGQAIASSDIFADHGFRVVAIFDTRPSKIGEQVGNASVRHPDDLKQVVEEEDIVVGVLAVPTAAAQQLADQLVDAGVKIIFNYSEALLQVPPEVTVHTSSPPSTCSTRCTST